MEVATQAVLIISFLISPPSPLGFSHLVSQCTQSPIHSFSSFNEHVLILFYCIPSTIQHAADTEIRPCFSPPGKPNLVGRQTRKEPIAIGNYSVVKAHPLKLPCH